MKSNLRWSIAFWAVNIIGWGGVSLIAYLFTPNIEGYKDTNFFVISLMVTFAVGIFTTGLLRVGIKNIKLDGFGKSEVLRISISILVTS